MPIEIATKEPSEIISGNYVEWKIKEGSNYPISDSWVLTYGFVNKGKQFSITAADNGDNYHLATISAAVTAKLLVGTYSWQSYITLNADRRLVSTGKLIIQPNFATITGGFDDRSHWQIVLDNVEAVIQGRATKDQSSYTVSGRQLSRTSIPDLLVLYNKAKSAVAGEKQAEAIANGLGHPGKILTRF